MFKKMLFLLFASAIAVSAAESAALTKSFKYQGKLYRTSMAPNGTFYRCDFGKTTLFSAIAVVGSYSYTGDRYDDRLPQGNAKKVSAKVETLGENRFRVISTGTIGNVKFAEAADYVQTTTFEPERILIQYKYVSKIPMMTRDNVFRNILNMPLSAVIDRGIVAFNKNKKEQVISVPATCEKGKGIMKGGFASMKFSLSDGIFEAVAGDKSSLTVMDCRSWGENNFRVDGTPVAFWKSVPENYPAGKVWEWSVEYKFLPHAD